MTHGPLPRVARENLRKMKQHILAIKPGATNIRFPNHRLFALQWQMTEFEFRGKRGNCMISKINGRCLIDWPAPVISVEPSRPSEDFVDFFLRECAQKE